MRHSRTHLFTAGLLLTGAAHAQVTLNEIHISMAGTDHDEFVELYAAPGTSLAGIMLLVVESDAGNVNGILDRAWDLTGNNFGATDPYYVAGNATPDVNPDFPLIGLDNFENSSATFYLVSVPDVNLRATIESVWLNTDVRTAVGATTTLIATTPGITILDGLAVMDTGASDTPFDNMPVFGPDGTFFPAGVFRSGDCPRNWCSDEFTSFAWDPDGSSNGGTPVTGAPNDPTPGTQNYLSPTCTTLASAGTCGSGGGNIGTNYCTANANSTGATGVMSATGSTTIATNNVTLRASSLPNNAFAFFLASRDAGFIANPGGSQGNLCVAGSIGRYVGPGQIKNSGATGTVSLAINLSSIPQPTGSVAAVSGETWRFTCWHRDVVGGSAVSNFANGLQVTFN